MLGRMFFDNFRLSFRFSFFIMRNNIVMLIAILLLGSHPKPKGLGFPAQDCNNKIAIWCFDSCSRYICKALCHGRLSSHATPKPNAIFWYPYTINYYSSDKFVKRINI